MKILIKRFSYYLGKKTAALLKTENFIQNKRQKLSLNVIFKYLHNVKVCQQFDEIIALTLITEKSFKLLSHT